MKEFVVNIPLRWGDMDAMSHLNNVMYFRLMEEARIQWFQEFGFPDAAHCRGADPGACVV